MSAPHVAERRAAYALQAAMEPALGASFDLLATAPQGVAKLRELVLSLAVQGKLVAQHFADEPATALIEQLRREKERLARAGLIRKERKTEPEELSDGNFSLPDGWIATPLSSLAWPQAGFAFKSNAFNDVGEGMPLIRIRDVGVSSPNTFFAGEYREEFVVREGDWLVSMDGDFRVASWKGPDSLLNQRVTRLVFFEPVVASYVCIALQKELRKLQGTKAYTTVDHLSGQQIASRVVPLPPLAEQARIVARVEELMQLCDALEAHGRLQDEQHARLVATLFDTLAASESAEALTENWQRIATHFDLLLDRPEAVDTLEQTLLQLAVRGLLVPQDRSEEPASQLLARILAEKGRLIADGEVKRAKPLPPITDSEKPFELPAGWEWARVASVGVTQTGGTPASNKPEYFDGNFPFIGPGQITPSGEMLPPEKFISELGRSESAVAEPGDILMVCIGGSIGKCVAAPFATAFNQQINSIHPLLVSSEFILTAMKASGFVSKVVSTATGSATPIISKGKWDMLLLPIPPLAEQHRLVARVEQLRGLCAGLRERLQQSCATQSRLAEALVARVGT